MAVLFQYKKISKCVQDLVFLLISLICSFIILLSDIQNPLATRRKKFRTPCSDLILQKLEFSRQVFPEKSLNIKFHENPSNGIRVVPYGRTDGMTFMTNFANAH